MGLRIPQYIRDLLPYRPGKPIAELARERNLDRIVKLASNENPLGASPLALAAVERSLAESHRYVDPSSFELTHALAERHGIAPERIICGAGTDALLAYIIQAFSAEGDEILTVESTFIGIFVNVRKLNRTLVTAPLVDYQFDLEALAGRITERTRIVYLASPNNPTGAIVTRNQFAAFLQRVPSDVLVILDEAYYSYAAELPEYHNGLTYDAPNLLVTRTFSKDYGLAGLRIGFAVGPEELIAQLYKVRLPFEPSSTAQAAGLAALDDDEFLQLTLDTNRSSLDALSRGFAELGLSFVPGRGNFHLLKFPSEAFAVRFAESCLRQGLILRHTAAFGAPEAVRINSGTASETEFALSVIKDVYTTMQAESASAVDSTLTRR
ncbi:MAG TPA: histidinol-phosphate transaminase [candidate division Zixibacteria bacterium]|nr:histidinol-phosphate transaminase [candidate division Zixibacteria bacterium]